MPTKKTAPTDANEVGAAVAAAYDEATTYDVKLTRAVSWRGSKFLPLFDHAMTGLVLNEIVETEGADAIDTAVAR